MGSGERNGPEEVLAAKLGARFNHNKLGGGGIKKTSLFITVEKGGIGVSTFKSRCTGQSPSQQKKTKLGGKQKPVTNS